MHSMCIYRTVLAQNQSWYSINFYNNSIQDLLRRIFLKFMSIDSGSIEQVLDIESETGVLVSSFNKGLQQLHLFLQSLMERKSKGALEVYRSWKNNYCQSLINNSHRSLASLKELEEICSEYLSGDNSAMLRLGHKYYPPYKERGPYATFLSMTETNRILDLMSWQADVKVYVTQRQIKMRLEKLKQSALGVIRTQEDPLSTVDPRFRGKRAFEEQIWIKKRRVTRSVSAPHCLPQLKLSQ